MFKSDLATYPQTSGHDTYAKNLGRAVRVFLAALLAAKPVDREVVVTKHKMSERARAKSIAELYRLMIRSVPVWLPNYALSLDKTETVITSFALGCVL